jgi:hypothetical protein
MGWLLQSINQYHQIMAQKQAELPMALCTIYISFLSLPSLQLSGEILHAPKWTRFLARWDKTNPEIKIQSPLQIIYFPISQNPRIEIVLKNQMNRLLYETNPQRRDAGMQELTLDAQLVLDQALGSLRNSALLHNPDPYVMNSALFGEIAAQYLRIFYAFPVVMFNAPQIIYHGIPNGMNPRQFVAFLLE